MPSLVDRTGVRFGRLFVVARDMSRPPASKGARVYWLCRCDCGNEVSRTGHELAAGDTTSCGCFQREETGKRNRTHGLTRSPTYRSWQAAKERCYNPSNVKYAKYGGAGVTMCSQWRDSFDAFLADMGVKPRGTTIDRIENDKGYEPGNCRWATAQTQAENRRGVGHNWKGKRMTIKAIAKAEGVPRTSLNKTLLRLGDLRAAVDYCQTHLK